VQNIKIGFGEVGCRKEKGCAARTDLLRRYYEISLNESWFIGGYFWWTAQTDILNDDFYTALQFYFQP
jgi:hypothetical protein